MRYLFIFLLFFIFYNSLAQDLARVKGNINDSKTGDVLMGVEISANNKTVGKSDIYGNYEFTSDTGMVELSVSLFGYISVTKIIHIQPGAVQEVNISLEPYLNELDEIVVSADKNEKKISDLSVSMNIIKPIEIIKTHVINAEELINRTQGIEVMDGQASIRGGSGFSYGAGSRVMALLDGLPAISIDAGNIRWQFLPLENLAQIEIIKGASSVLYGSSALNGVINFRTAGADTISKTRFEVISGIYDHPRNENWLWWNSPRSYSSASFSFSKRINNTEIGIGSNVLVDNGYRRLNDEKLARLNFRLKQHSKIPGLIYGLGLNSGYNVKRDFILWEDADSGALKQNEQTATELNGYFISLDPSISYSVNKFNRHDFRMRIQRSENTYPDNRVNETQNSSVFSEYQFYSRFFGLFDLTSGLSHQFNQIISGFYGDHQCNNLAGYSQLEYGFNKKIKASLGIRLEYNKLDSFSDNIVPVFRSGINYELARSSFLRISFGQGYRYPSIAEKFAYTSLGAVKIFPNTEILPEYGWSSEIGFKQGLKFGETYGQIDVSLFYSQNKDMIEYAFGIYRDPFTGEFGFGFRSSNLEKSRVYGTEIEFGLNRSFHDFNINIGGGYTYIYPVELNANNNQSDSVYLKYRRKHTAKFIFNASYRKLEAGISLFFKSKILNIDNVFLNPLTRESLLPGFYDYWMLNNDYSLVFDTFFSYRLTKNLKISFAIKNAGNAEYMGRPGDIQAQRFYSLQVSGLF